MPKRTEQKCILAPSPVFTPRTVPRSLLSVSGCVCGRSQMDGYPVRGLYKKALSDSPEVQSPSGQGTFSRWKRSHLARHTCGSPASSSQRTQSPRKDLLEGALSDFRSLTIHHTGSSPDAKLRRHGSNLSLVYPVLHDLFDDPDDDSPPSLQAKKRNFYNRRADELNENSKLKNEALTIFNEDGSYKTISVDQRMQALDVCEIMLSKNHLTSDSINWQLYSEPSQLPGYERAIEDHEYVFDLYERWLAADESPRFWFRWNPRKYHLSEEMREVLTRTDSTSSAVPLSAVDDLRGVSEGVLWLKRPQCHWIKSFCFIIASAIFFTKKAHKKNSKDSDFLLDLSTMDIYVARRDRAEKDPFQSPTPFSIAFLPSTVGFVDIDSIIVIAATSEAGLKAWSEGLRFHKFGRRKLADNLAWAADRRSSSIESKEPNRTPTPVSDALSKPKQKASGPRKGATLNFKSLINFEGLLYEDGCPFLLIQTPDGLTKTTIEIFRDSRGMRKFYRLRGHKERFCTTDELADFYFRNRDDVLQGFHTLKNSTDESATRF
uniref:Growth factor receptor-bound protein 14 n=1 Tax=Schistocephalus solidus TaxID=70667 RepID=A0A0X3P1G1_SCHSO